MEIKSELCFLDILRADHSAVLRGRIIYPKYLGSQNKKRGEHNPSGGTVFPGDQGTQTMRPDLFLSSCYIQVCAEEG